MEVLLESVGLPPILAMLPMEYLVVLIGLALFFKFVFLPATNKFITDSTKKIDDIIENLQKINNNNEIISNKLNKIELIIQDLQSDSIGSVDSTLAISTFAQIIDTNHLRSLNFYTYRLQVNHYVGSESVIQSRYANKSNELAGKIFSQLSKYHYNGVALSTF